jgi:hypothetical protein
MRSRRQDVIVQLLERFGELSDPVRSGGGFGSNGLLLMPHERGCRLLAPAPEHLWQVVPARWRPSCSCAMRSVVELERLLATMRDDSTRSLLRLPSGGKVSVRGCWWHLNERYIRATTRTAWRCPKCHAVSHSERHSHRDRRGKLCGYPCVRVLVDVFDAKVEPAKVERGLVWLADGWGLAGEPELPVLRSAA